MGHYCPEGVDAEIRCANGTYQDQETQSSCKVCPAGYFCDNTMGIVVLDNSTTVCPMGSYCPTGTRYANEFLCPIGTFSNITGEGRGCVVVLVAQKNTYLNFVEGRLIYLYGWPNR